MAAGAAAAAAIWTAAGVATTSAAVAAGTATMGAIVAAGAINGLIIGAAIGAATSVITGGDIVKGTLMGAALGGVTGGAGSYLGAAFGAGSSLVGTAPEGAALTNELGIAAGDMTIANADAALTADAAAANTAEVGVEAGTTTGIIGNEAAKAAQAPTGPTSAAGGQPPVLESAIKPPTVPDNSVAGALKEMNAANLADKAAMRNALYATTAAQVLGPVFTSMGKPDEKELLQEKYALEQGMYQDRLNSNQAGAIGASELRKYRALQSFSDKYKAYLAATLQKPTTSVSGSVAGNRGLLQTA